MPLEGFDDADVPERDSGRRSGPGSGAKIDLGIVARGASIGCTRDELAALCDVAPSTFYKHLEEDPALQEALAQGAARGRVALRRFQWKGAEDGNASMLIWLGKQLLGQRDTQTTQTLDKDGNPIDPPTMIVTGVVRASDKDPG